MAQDDAQTQECQRYTVAGYGLPGRLPLTGEHGDKIFAACGGFREGSWIALRLKPVVSDARGGNHQTWLVCRTADPGDQRRCNAGAALDQLALSVGSPPRPENALACKIYYHV